MKDYKRLIAELRESSGEKKKAVFTFGRFQGLSVGHEKLLDSLFKLPGDHFVFVSQTKDADRNPMNSSTKIKLLKKAYPQKSKSFRDDCRTVIEAVRAILGAGYTEVTMMVGEDRVDDFRASLDGFEFPIRVKSAGRRSENSSDPVVSSEGSNLRDSARAGDFKAFSNAAMTKLDAESKVAMFNEIREAYGKPKLKMSSKEKLREDYLSGKLFSVGDIVTEKVTGKSFKVLDLGSNYVRVANQEGSISRKWIEDVEVKRSATKTFGESFKTVVKSDRFTFNGYTPKFTSQIVSESFSKSVDVEDQYALLEAIKETEKYLNSSDIKTRFDSFVRSGKFLNSCGILEEHRHYRTIFESDMSKSILNNPNSINTIFKNNRQGAINFFADVAGVNYQQVQENTLTRCLNKIGSIPLTEKEKKVYGEIVNTIVESGLEYEFDSFKVFEELSYREGSDSKMLVEVFNQIESYVFSDVVKLYDIDSLKVITEGFGKQSVKVTEPLDDKKIDRRAKQIAVQYMKQRKSKKAVDRLTTQEKAKIEEIVSQKGSILTMISRKLGKKIRKMEEDRMCAEIPNEKR